MHPRLSVNTIGFGARPIREVLGELIAEGIHRVGVPMVQLELGGLHANIATLRVQGFEVASTVVPMAFSLGDPDAWTPERARIRAAVDAAAELECGVLYLTTGAAAGLTWDGAAASFARALAPLLPYAAAAGVRLAIENTSTIRADLGFVHRLSDAVDAARLAGISVCADLFAAWTDRDLAAALAGAGPDLALVQVADFVVGTLQTPDRAVPGDGDIPIERQLADLAAAGYRGLIELELLGPRIAAEGPARAAARGLAAISAWL
jgi:sugar phosphate isomerase/epimerase